MEGTAKEARRRTAAQTKAKNEDGVGEEGMSTAKAVTDGSSSAG